MKAAALAILMLFVGMLFVTPVAAARSASTASPDVVCTIPQPSCGGGTCWTYTVTVHVYTTAGVSDGLVDISGIGDVGDGWSGPFNECSHYTIAADHIASGYAFWYWYGAELYVDNPNASSTFFSPETNGVLMLVLKQGPAISNWAGYTQSGSFTSVTGTFKVPTSISYAGNGSNTGFPCGIPSDAYDFVGYWVGIGGMNGGANGNGYALWQAGVDLFVRPSGAYYPLAFYETYYEVNYNTGSGGYPHYMCNVAVHAGDTVKIQLSYGANISSGSITVNQTSWPFPSQSFRPDTSTAEWIVESPDWAAPETGPVHFTGCSSSAHGDLQAPILGVFTTDAYDHPLSPQTIIGAYAFDVVYG